MSDQPLTVPQVTPRPGGHEFFWAAEGCYIRIERLREHHDSITAEVWAEVGEKREHLLGGLRFSLTTPGGRASIIKALDTCRQQKSPSNPNGVDWRGMVEQVSVYTLRKFREQDPFTSIGEGTGAPPLKFRLRPVLPEGVTTVLYGYGGVLKTTMAIFWGLLVQLGETRLGLEPMEGLVMLLDWETDKDIAERTQQMLHAGMGLSGRPRFIYRRCRRPLLDFVEDAQAEAQREGVVLVIADSFTKACGGEKEAKENALPTLSALQLVAPTVLSLTHRPKGAEGKDRGAYGSAYIENDARQAFRADGRHEADVGAAQVVLTHAKYNLMRPLHPFGYRVTWDDLLGIKVETQDVGEMGSIGGDLAVKRQLEEALRHGALTVAQLSQNTGIAEATIRTKLNMFSEHTFTTLPGKEKAKSWALKEERNSDV